MKKLNMIMSICLLLMMIPIQAFSIPNVPSNVTLTSVSQTEIRVTWQGVSDADNYTVYWGLTADANDGSETVGQSIRQYTISGLSAGTKYYVAVSASNETGESSKSATKSIITQSDTIIPSTPKGFKVTSLSEITQNSISLKWTKNSESDLDHYTIYYGKTSGSLSSTKEATDSDADSFVISGLSASSRYYFAITAVDISDNESEKSSELVVDTLEDNLPPFVPVITAEMSGQNEITIRISDINSGMADYDGSIIFYGTNPGSSSQSVDVGKNKTFVIGNLPEDKTWYLSALSYDIYENRSGKSDEITVKIEDTQSFLGKDEDFDGGCFIQESSSQSCTFNLICLALVIPGIMLFLFSNKLIKAFVSFMVIFLNIMAVNVNAGDSPMPKENLIGVSVGYYIPSESDFYDDSVFPVYAFYERCIYNYISADIEAGYFKEDGNLLTVSGDQTEIGSEISMIPVSATLKINKQIIPYIVGYIGVGPDYWYCREKTDMETQNDEIEEWVGGYHAKMGVKLYNMDEQFENTGAILECVYSVVDKFGNNDLNIGGLTLKFGLFYQF
jgi:fibronectin type 3 domain-containing protein